jgi:hypothetical protein
MTSSRWQSSRIPGKSITETCTLMVYLISKNADANLSAWWESFHKLPEGKIGELLSRCSYKEINLCVPRIGRLSSDLDLKDILRNTHGSCGPAALVESKMMVYICFDKDGMAEAALAETTCRGSTCLREVLADKPYIAFVYDMNLRRVLFVVKDMGCTDRERWNN